jgi:3-oxoacyl-[acyl-carrier protein] reductase
MELGLRDRVAIISGASQGLGKAAALAFAAEGVNVALCARNQESLQQLSDEISSRFAVQTKLAALDVRDGNAIQRFVDETAEHFGRLDICVANAGGPPAKDFLDTTDKEWDDAFALNLKSAAIFSRAVIPHMQKRKWGRIVMISSIAVKQPQAQLVLSNAVRTGVLGLVRSLANDFGKDGILVNNVGPGYTATDRLKELATARAKRSGETTDQIEESWTSQIPLGRLGQPEELADTIVWLASERASYITGQTVLVDGGMYKGI